MDFKIRFYSVDGGTGTKAYLTKAFKELLHKNWNEKVYSQGNDINSLMEQNFAISSPISLEGLIQSG